jgi:hypothetical protein
MATPYIANPLQAHSLLPDRPLTKALVCSALKLVGPVSGGIQAISRGGVQKPSHARSASADSPIPASSGQRYKYSRRAPVPFADGNDWQYNDPGA